MAFARWERPIVDNAGKPIPGAVVTVRREVPGFPLAVPLYGDFDGGTTIDNPVTADAQGIAAFHVVGGFYRLDIVAPGFSRTLRHVGIGTAAGTDIDAYAIAGFTWAPESDTAAPPSAEGCIRFDDADLAAAAHVFVHKTTLSGTDAEAWLAGLAAGGKSVKNRLMLATSDSREINWQVDAVSAVGDYVDLTVSGYAGPSSPQAVSDAGFVTLAAQIGGADGYMPGMPYAFDGSGISDADPGAGKVRFNHATNPTIAYVSKTDGRGVTVTSRLNVLDDSVNATGRARLSFEPLAASGAFLDFDVTGAITDATNYLKIPVALRAGAVPADGAVMALNTAVAGRDGYTPGYRFTFSTTITDADPGNGGLRFNHGTFGSISYLFVDNQDAAAVSVTAWLDGLDDAANSTGRATLRLQKADDPTVYAEFTVTGAVVDGSGYRKIPVTPVAGAVPANGVTLVASAAKSGSDGAGDMSSASYPDLVAIEALSGTGIPARTASQTWALRTLSGTTNEITITNPAGVAGAPTFALAARAKLVSREIPLRGWFPPTSNYMTLDTRNGIPVFDADTSTQEAIYTAFTVPDAYAGGGLTLTFEAMATSATSGTLGWDVAIDKSTGTDNDSFSFATAKTATASTVPGTSGVAIKFTVAFSNSEIDGMAAGDHGFLRIRRDVANDNAAGDGELMFLSAKLEMTP